MTQKKVPAKQGFTADGREMKPEGPVYFERGRMLEDGQTEEELTNRELEGAKAGRYTHISAAAAALFLGLSPEALEKRRVQPWQGPSPRFVERADGSILYLWKDAERSTPGKKRGRPAKISESQELNQKLSAAQRQELADAEAGLVGWVSPAVAAHVMGITTSALQKRRQGKSLGIMPTTRNGPGGFEYEWNAVRGQSPELVKSTEAMRRRIQEQEATIGNLQSDQAAIKSVLRDMAGWMNKEGHLGINVDALNVMALWTTDNQGRLTGHAALADANAWAHVVQGQHSATLTWMDALRQPWRHEDDRAPYHQAALGVLEHAQAEAKAPVGG